MFSSCPPQSSFQPGWLVVVVDHVIICTSLSPPDWAALHGLIAVPHRPALDHQSAGAGLLYLRLTRPGSTHRCPALDYCMAGAGAAVPQVVPSEDCAAANSGQFAAFPMAAPYSTRTCVSQRSMNFLEGCYISAELNISCGCCISFAPNNASLGGTSQLISACYSFHL